MSLHAVARPLPEGLRHEVVVDRRHVLVTDEPTALGGTDTAPTPHELLPAALASCIATTMAMYARRRGWDLGDVEVEVDYDHRAEPRRFDVTIRLPDALDAEQIARLARVAASCPVHRALETGFSFQQRLIVDGSADSQAA